MGEKGYTKMTKNFVSNGSHCLLPALSRARHSPFEFDLKFSFNFCEINEDGSSWGAISNASFMLPLS